MRTLLAHQLAQQHPLHDPHPLAREDGGWYPGKHFDPTDILTDPRNWTVWKQFLLFFFGILCVPVLSFVGVEWILRAVFHLKFQQSQTIGAVVAIVVLQIFMISYARRAVLEERTDYAEQQQQQLNRKEVPEEGSSSVDQGAVSKTKEGSESEETGDKTDEKTEKGDSVVGGIMTEETSSSKSKVVGLEKEVGGSLIAEDGSVTKDGEDASLGSVQAQDETMPEKPDNELGVGGQVKKRK